MRQEVRQARGGGSWRGKGWVVWVGIGILVFDGAAVSGGDGFADGLTGF